MKPQPPTGSPERAETDASLQLERRHTDAALSERRVGVEADANDVLERAREQADAVLKVARGKADAGMDPADGDGSPMTVVVTERAFADALLEHERATANERLRRERAALLPLERGRTDQHLEAERTRADDLLAHRVDVLGMVSHELRSLLYALGLTASQLSTQASDSADGRRTVEGMKRMQRYVVRMDTLLGDLIDVVRNDADQLALQRERCDAAGLLGEAQEAFARVASEKGIALTADSAGGPLLADLDRDRIVQMLSNLIGNALKYTPRGGRVTVHAAQIEREIRFSVSDTGVGIPSNLLGAVFHRFSKDDDDSHTRGLGLGLYISKRITEAHGGRIWVESTVGEGSVFHVTLPAGAEPS